MTFLSDLRKGAALNVSDITRESCCTPADNAAKSRYTAQSNDL